MEKSIREDYHKIVKEQIYIPPHLKMVQEFDMVIIDRQGMLIGSMRGSLYAPKDTQKLPKSSPLYRQIFHCLYTPNLVLGSDEGLGHYQGNP